jgi:hypothetical protein
MQQDSICDGGKGVHVYVLDTGIRISHVRFTTEDPDFPVATNFQNKIDSPYCDEKMVSSHPAK